MAEREGPTERGKRNERHVRRVLRSPCNRPPERPDPPTFTVKAREAKTHLEFSGKVVVDEGGLDTSGFPITISEYVVEGRARLADDSPADTEGSRDRIRERRKVPPQRTHIDELTNPTGTTYRVVTVEDHNLAVGDHIRIVKASPAGYNGSWTVASVVNATTFTVTGSSSGLADATKPKDSGTVLYDDDDPLAVIVEHLPRPKTWYWQWRQKSRSSEGCWSRWSAWSTKILPWTGADPQPPAPTIDSFVLNRDGKAPRNPWLGKMTLTPVRDWDVPGGDREDDVQGYYWRCAVSEDGGSSWKLYRKGYVEDEDDEDGDDKIKIIVPGRFRRGHRYRVKAGTVDRFGRRGPATAWYPSASGRRIQDVTTGNDGTSAPLAGSAVTVRHLGPLEWRIKWTAPSDDTDVDRYRVDVHVGGSGSAFESINVSRRTHVLHYRGDKANKGSAHRFKIYAEDEEGNASSSFESGDEADDTGPSDSEWDVGDIRPRGKTGTPTRWLLCDGTGYSTSTEAELFAAIGYTHGGAGATFNVPDIRRRIPMGAGTDEGLGVTEGTATESSRDPEHGQHQNHQHGHRHGSNHKHRHDHKHRHRHVHEGDHHHNITFGGSHDHGGNTGSANAGPGSGGAATPTDLTRIAHTHTIGTSGSNHDHDMGTALNPSEGGKSYSDEPLAYVSGGGGSAGSPASLMETASGVSTFTTTSSEGSPTAKTLVDASITAGSSEATQIAWTEVDTDATNPDNVIDESGAPASKGHKKHPRIRLFYIIKARS